MLSLTGLDRAFTIVIAVIAAYVDLQLYSPCTPAFTGKGHSERDDYEYKRHTAIELQIVDTYIGVHFYSIIYFKQ